MVNEIAAKTGVVMEVDAAEVRAAEEFVARLSLAARNISLYPAYHGIPQKSLSDLHAHLDNFTARFGDLVLEVGKAKMKYQGHGIAAGMGAQDNVAYLCYRDGIQELTFAAGTEISELWEFLNILNAHRIIEEENEGDIVTDLWEAGLLHIKYSTNNRLWADEPLLDLHRLNVGPQNDDAMEQLGAEEPPFIFDSSASPQPWELQAEEIEATYRMVAEEENRDFHRDVFDVLLIILNEQRAKEDFATVLEIIQECLVKTLSTGQFPSVARFLKNFRRIHQKYKNDGHWAQAYLDDFMLMVSSPRVMSVLKTYLQKIDGGDLKSGRELLQMLLQLPPESISRLGPMLPQVRSQPIAETLRKAIAQLAQTDIRPLAHLAKNATFPVAKEALDILCDMPHQEAVSVLSEVSRSPEPAIRRLAVLGLSRRDSDDYDRFLGFLSDADEQVRKIAFAHLCRRRMKGAEAALIDYLQKKEWLRKDTDLMNVVYAALGKCGSNEALPFLKKQLFGTPWRIGRLRAAHRAGAAMAICRINDSEADRLFKKARKSISPPVRRAVHRAMELNDAI